MSPHSQAKERKVNMGCFLEPYESRTLLDVIDGKWDEILRYTAKAEKIDSVTYTTDLKPMKVKSVDASDPLCWKIYINMEDFDSHLDTYMEIKYSASIKKAIKEMLLIDCTLQFKAEGCKGTSRFGRKGSLFRGLTFRRKPYSSDAEEERRIRDAMALFMIGSLEDISKDAIRRQRNLLMKTFHPDGSGLDDRYAEAINNSYEILQKYVK